MATAEGRAWRLEVATPGVSEYVVMAIEDALDRCPLEPPRDPEGRPIAVTMFQAVGFPR